MQVTSGCLRSCIRREKSIASTPVQQNCTGFHETDDAVIAEKINRAVCHQRNVDSNCISLVNIRFMEHFCNSNQSFHVFNPTGFANGKNCTSMVCLNPVHVIGKAETFSGLVSGPLSLQRSTTSVQTVLTHTVVSQ